MAFLHAMGGVFGLILMGMVGYVLAGKGWFGPETRILLPRLITYVALPPYLMSTIMRAFRRDGLLDFIQGALLPLAAVALTFVLAIIIGKIARVQRQHFGLFCASVANSNTIFVGIPVNLALFGEEAVPYVLLYYFASTVFFWTVGQYAITRDIEGEARLIPLRTRVMQIFSPPLLGFLTGLLLILCNVELPFFIQDAARYLGNMTTPLALIFIGITMHDMGLRGVTISRDMALTLLGHTAPGQNLLHLLIGRDPVLLEAAQKVVALSLMVPLLVALQNVLQGFCIVAGRNTWVNGAGLVGVTLTLLAARWGVAQGWPGASAGAAAVALGLLAEVSLLAAFRPWRFNAAS